MKPFYKRSEFWATIFNILGATGASYKQILDPKYAVFISTLSTIAYTISSGIAKSGSK